MYAYTYVCIYAITINEKEALNLKDVRKSIWENLEDGRGRGK